MSFGTFDAQSGRHTHHFTAAPSRHLAAAEDEIYFGLFDDVRSTLSTSADEPAVQQALDQLFGALRERKLNSPAEDWTAFIARARRHPLMELLHQDPFTSRAFNKP